MMTDTRKSERLEKQTTLMTPVKRKPEKNEKQNTPSPLRRSERGKKDPSSSSSEIRCFAETSNSAEANRKSQREKNLNELHEEATEVGVCRKNGEEFSGIKRKRFGDARSFKRLFRPQYMGDITADDSRRKSAPSDTDCVISQLSVSKLMEPTDKEVNRGRESANDAEFNAHKKSNQSTDSRNLDPICDVTPSSSEFASPFIAETCGKCSKRLRLKHDSPEQELCSCNGAEDPGANGLLRSVEKLGNCDKLIGYPGDPQMGCHDKVCYVCLKYGDLL